MHYDISYMNDEEIAVITIEGKLTTDGICLAMAKMVQAASIYNTHFLLIDLRYATLQASTSDIYRLPLLLQSVGITRQHRQALVVTNNKKDHDFFETVSVNRGYSVRIFNDEDEAKMWLKGKNINC